MRKSMIFLSVLVLISCLAVGAGMSTTASGQQKYTLRISTVISTSDPIYKGYTVLAENIRKRTNGAIQATVYPDAQLGQDEDLMEQALLAAYEAGDLTQAGVLAAAKSLESVTFDGLAPDETYVGEPNDRVQRAQFISRPDPAGLADGTSTGTSLIESMYTSPTAEAYEFNETCFELG